MAYPNTEWQTNPILATQPSSLNLQPTAPVQGPVQPATTNPYPTGTSTSSPTPTVAPTAPREPTIAETLQGIKDKALGVQAQLNAQNAAKAGLSGLGYDTATNPYALPLTQKEQEAQDKAIQRNQMKLFQKEIDATNRVYSDMLQQERLAGQGRLGSQTAMAARGGLLGSDFGEAQRQTQVGANLGAERAVENERLAKIGTIMGTMRKAVADEIANKRLARQQDAQSYIGYLAGSKTRREANLKLAASSLIDAGIDPLTMDPSELDAIGKEANLSANDIITQYRQLKKEQEAAAAESGLKTRKTEAEIAKIEADIAKGKLIELGEGTMLYNTETGETFKNPKTSTPGTGSGLKIGGQSVDLSTVASTHQLLDGLRGEDGYTDTAKYQEQLGSFVDLGGDPKDFVKEFDPNIYINPNDPTRSYLQAYMKKTPEEAALSDVQELEQTMRTLDALRSNQ